MPSAVARQREGYTHDIEIREHRLIADEPPDKGGTDTGPTPTELLAASLASCTSATLLMYTERKQWDLGGVEVEVDFEEGASGMPAQFDVRIRLGAENELDEEQRKRVLVIAGKCPVHRALASNEIEVADTLEPLTG